MMPISDIVGYEPGHFDRVYKYLIKPACEKAQFKPIRADDVVSSNHIVIDILRKIIDSHMVLCDLSAKNPNVLYELGLRQAFNKPAALIKDDKTADIFDIQGFRYFPYDHQLRIDNVKIEIDKIAHSLTETYNNSGQEVNSIVQLLGVEPAKLGDTVQLSREDSVLLEAINSVAKRLSSLERQHKNTNRKAPQIQHRGPDEYAPLINYLKGGALDLAIGREFYENGTELGTLIDYDVVEGYVDFAQSDQGEVMRVEIDSPLFERINQIPF